MKLFQIKVRGRGKEARQGSAGGGPLRVFVTGATGYIGKAVVRELAAAGHEVTGLTRWAESTLSLKALGARAVVGDLRDPLTYRKVAAAHDALVHVAIETGPGRAAADRAALEALIRAARPREDEPDDVPPRVLVYTSGCYLLGETGDGPAAEDWPTDRAPEYAAWRVPHERLALEANTERLAVAVIRPGMVFGGRGGTFDDFFSSAETEGAAAYVGDGRNRWSPVHLDDIARLYRLVVERRARGIFHGNDGTAPAVAELARAASEAAGRGGAVRSIPLEDARRRLGGAADAMVMDQVMASPRSRELGWEPEHPPFLESAVEVYREWKEGA